MVPRKRDDEEDFSDASEYVPAGTPPQRQKDAGVEGYQKSGGSAEESSTSNLHSASSRSNLRKYIRLKGCYNDNYRKLLNTTISEASSISVDDDLEIVNPMLTLPPFDLGGTSWTTDEKRILYRAVARYGRDELPRIASSLHNKSETEVRAYLEFLQKIMLQLARSEHGGLKSAKDEMHAAIEVSYECLMELDTCADALAWYQFTWEAKQEHKAYGEFWLLDREVADEITEALDVEEDETIASSGESESNDSPQAMSAEGSTVSKTGRNMSRSASPGSFSPVLAAELLNLSNFIELSERVFMNSKDAEWDWRSFRDAGKPDKSQGKLSRAEESPAIFRTAFDDFHTVAVNITKRIMHAALFQATSRLRAKDKIERPLASDPCVERRDVLAALEILSLKKSSFEHWATLPRRHKIDWFYNTDTNNKPKGRQVNAEQAERYLRHEGKIDHSKVEGIFQAEEVESIGQLNSQESSSESDHESGSHSNLGDDQAASPYDQYLELLDLQASKVQEQHIWDSLGKEAPSGANLLDVVEAKIPKSIPTIEQGTSSFADWRAWTECRAKWELDESDTSEDEAMESEDDQSPDEDGVSLSWISIPQSVVLAHQGEDDLSVGSERYESHANSRNRGWSAIGSPNGSKRKRSQTTTGIIYNMDMPFRKRHEERSPSEMEEEQRFLGDEPAWLTQVAPTSDDEQESNSSQSLIEKFGHEEGPRFDESE